jgi:putative sigma-54 modulation protein
MNLKITGLHLEVTPPLREYIESKLERVTRHVDNVIEVGVTLSVDKLVQKAEVNLHLPPGKDIHVEATEEDMYAAVDVVMDKLDRQVLKHKEKLAERRASPPTESPAPTGEQTEAETEA